MLWGLLWFLVELGAGSACLEFKFMGRERAVEVCNELLQVIQDLDRREEERKRWVDALGKGVCWILPTCDVVCDNRTLVSREDVMDLLEDSVCLFVMTSPLPPSLNNVLVVTKEPEKLARLTSGEDRADKELKSNCFSPPDVSSFSLSAWEKPSCSPKVNDDNNNADP
jgi:hypothetical protein